MKNNLHSVNKFARFIILFSFVTLSPTPRLCAADAAHDIALDLSIPGKSGWTSCDNFARNLYPRITGTGGEATYIVYDWKDESHFCGRHAFIVFRDAQGRYWGMDNRTAKPKWLNGTTPRQWTQYFAGDVDTAVVYSHTNVWLIGCSAGLNDTANISPAAQSDSIGRVLPETGRPFTGPGLAFIDNRRTPTIP
jgi:hypothetical protein